MDEIRENERIMWSNRAYGLRRSADSWWARLLLVSRLLSRRAARAQETADWLAR